MATHLILGTAGHIDHGKTALIRALTGVDTDRLPEERRRGITIELGFAELHLGEYRLGVVDVPGHERFVRNMLAGATGMDLALLVVAADDSVKLQTREHFEILRLLNLEAGVIALTKCDLVEPEWLELVEEEIRDLVAGSFLQDAPLVPTSVVTGAGLDELRDRLTDAAARAARSNRLQRVHGPFRMAIDRAFTIAGHGTVVTGSVSSGRAALGDELMIQPGDVAVRVRSLRNHDREVDEVHRGQRAAINLAGVYHGAIERGQELCSPGHLRPSRLLSVRVNLLPQSRPLKDRSRVRVHLGTAELFGAVRLLDGSRVPPGDQALAQLLLNRPAVAVWGQPFVLRSESPVATIGGGVVLDPWAPLIRRRDEQSVAWLRRLDSSNVDDRAAASLYFAGIRGWEPADLSGRAGVEPSETLVDRLSDEGQLVEVPLSPTRSMRLHRDVFAQLCHRVVGALDKLHDHHPLKMSLPLSLLQDRFRGSFDPPLLSAVLNQLQQEARIRRTTHGVALVGRGPKLSQNERKLLQQLVERFREAGIETPTVEQCRREATRLQQAVPGLINLAVENGDLVAVGPGYFLHHEVDQQMRRRLAEAMDQNSGLTVSQIREILNTSRKYAVPYCEYLDRTGFTVRRGDRRFLAQAEP